jgi:glycosyltransferase involved in cell wall biosynthesis
MLGRILVFFSHLSSSLMLQLGFACTWLHGDARPRSWSGIPNGLSMALAARGQDVELLDIDCTLSHRQTLAHKVSGLVYRDGRRRSRYQFMPSYLNAVKRQFYQSVQKLSHTPDAILQIGDLARIDTVPYYTYQDLSTAYVLEYRKQTGQPLPAYEMYTLREIERRWERQADFYAAAKGVFTMSEWLRQYIIQNGILPANAVHTVHAATNVPQLSPEDRANARAEKKGKMMLFVGRDWQRKGGDAVMRAFQIVRQRRTEPLTLVIAGPRTWQSIAPAGNRIPEGVTFLGDASNNALAPYFAQADVFCMPSLFEAFGIVFPEALSAGVPCIGRNAYAMPEIIRHGENGYLLGWNGADESDEALAELIMMALDNDAMQGRVWAEREETARYYSWERAAAQVVEIIGRECG